MCITFNGSPEPGTRCGAYIYLPPQPQSTLIRFIRLYGALERL
jgi:hypothetical protein